MTDYREILRLDSLGFSKQSIADSRNCARNTVKSVLDAAQVNGIKWQGSSTPNNEALRKLLFPNANVVRYRMPDYRTARRLLTTTSTANTYRRLQITPMIVLQSCIIIFPFIFYLLRKEIYHITARAESLTERPETILPLGAEWTYRLSGICRNLIKIS